MSKNTPILINNNMVGDLYNLVNGQSWFFNESSVLSRHEDDIDPAPTLTMIKSGVELCLG